SLAECAAENFATAAELLEWGRGRSPSYAPFVANDLHIHQKWTCHLCELHQFADAYELLERGHQRRPDARLFAGGRAVVMQMWAQWLRQEGRRDEALRIAEQGLEKFPSQGALQQLRTDLRVDLTGPQS